MASEHEALTTMAKELANVVADRREAARASRLADRFAAGRFLISMVGEFKRGTSTLLTALVGAHLDKLRP